MTDIRSLVEKLASNIDNPKERSAFLGTIKEETGFKAKEENLNYSANKLIQLRDLWIDTKDTDSPKGFSKLENMSDQEIQTLVNQGPEAIANKIYGNRMGNSSNEGYKYRGRGPFMLTGKNNYKKLSKELFPQDPNKLVDNPDLVNDPKIIEKITKSYWNKISSKVDFKNTPKDKVMDKVTDIINPGTDTRERRRKYFGEFHQQDWNKEAQQAVAEDEDNQLKKQYEFNKKAMQKSIVKKQMKQNIEQESFLRPSPIRKQFNIDERKNSKQQEIIRKLMGQ